MERMRYDNNPSLTCLPTTHDIYILHIEVSLVAMANTGGNNAGTNFGQKVRGAWNTVEGAGDKLRGGILDFADSATGTGGHHAETDVGEAKMQQGVAQTRQPATSTTTAAAPTTTTNANTAAAPAAMNANTAAAPATTNASTAAPAAGTQPTTTTARNGTTGIAGPTH
ncbi:hypothetical protein DAEQUDRAFT_137491 [Daedalea quercina L-15889]|uniref:Uncharacterized protein n=1 Tax=Daedalea quercina L-15889 TaxID=1314783 RepID=A0A165RSH2_9APHY|nr:hypothetical protein DAEQUDRAFT_137491 [Daedalea quercina L-15889]